MKIDSGILYKSLIKSYYTKSDAYHIVACVRNCEGINPKAVTDVLEALKVLVMCHAKGGFIQPDTDVLEQAKVAIAKAEEK